MVLKKSDKIGTGYESLHIMGYILSLQFLQVDVVLVGVVLKDLLDGTTFKRCIKFIEVVVFSKATIIVVILENKNIL